MGYIDIDIDIDIIAIYMKHDTINNQPTKETRCNNNHNNILQIHFYDDTPLFLRKIMSFFGWIDGWREEKGEKERELYNVEKMNIEKST